METANVNDPASIEAIYPRADFERDARQNSRAKATVHHGVRILSAPDGEGRFSLEQADQHVGESHESFHSVFVCPFLDSSEYGKFAKNDTDYGGPVERRKPPQDDADPYRAFLAKVVETARSAEFPSTDVDDRLRGAHGG